MSKHAIDLRFASVSTLVKDCPSELLSGLPKSTLRRMLRRMLNQESYSPDNAAVSKEFDKPGLIEQINLLRKEQGWAAYRADLVITKAKAAKADTKPAKASKPVSKPASKPTATKGSGVSASSVAKGVSEALLPTLSAITSGQERMIAALEAQTAKLDAQTTALTFLVEKAMGKKAA
jgi:hypothetical protein